MIKGKILYFDDDDKIINNFRTAFSQSGTNLDFVGTSDEKEFRSYLDSPEYMKDVRVLIFDLAKNKKEQDTHGFEIKKDIIGNFNNYRIPIFIHSAFADYFTELDGRGTVFKVEKSGAAIQTICEKIKLMHESRFLDIFCLGGILESAFMKELHDSFTEQFRNNEIEEIIKAIKNACTSAADCRKRTEEVFRRIAVRSLIHNLTDSYDDNGIVKEVGLNSAEHYYRRTSAYSVWTGDIFRNKSTKELLFVVTPRCDVVRPEYTQVLVCKINPISTNLAKGDHLKEAINDNARLTAGKFRILPQNPLFEGGQIEYPLYVTVSKTSLESEHERIITLSDELTNDIVRKFCAYLLRSGVSETELNEAKKYIETAFADQGKRSSKHIP